MKFWYAVFLCLMSWPAWGVLPYASTPEEQAMCKIRVFDRVGFDRHYCDGLRYINRALRTLNNPNERRYYLGEAISHFDYVLSHYPKDYVARPEIHLAKAQVYRMSGQKPQAISELMQVMQYNVHWPELYQALAENYVEAGDKKKALEMVSEGLRHNPESKGLQRRYKELGGKEPYPEPYAPVETKPETPPAADVVPAPVTTSEDKQSAESADHAVRTEEPKTEASSSAPGQEIRLPAESQHNPWYRLCPDQVRSPRPASSTPPAAPTTVP